MKSKLYIVTYRGADRLAKTLKSLFDSDYIGEIFIINNHTEFEIPDIYKDKVDILHNTLRPDASTGHLSRNWNQSLINGFKNLIDPDCENVITIQDDTIFQPDWYSAIKTFHKKYTFIQNGHGDQLCSYLPEAVRRVGIWDERFCGISMQATDYFYRCVMYNREESSINDIKHSRVLNPLINNYIEAASMLVDNDPRKIDEPWSQEQFSLKIAQKLVDKKFGTSNVYPWTREKLLNPLTNTKIPNYIVYPYFEKDIYNLEDKNYMV